MVVLDAAALWVVACQSRVTAEPDTAGGVRHDAVDRIARKTFLARNDLKADRLRGCSGSHYQRESASIRCHPNAIASINRERIDGIGRQGGKVTRIVAEDLDDVAIWACEVEPAAFRSHPHIALRVLGERGDSEAS